MNYQQLVRDVGSLGFIRNRDPSETAVREVLGIFVSRLEDPLARRFTRNFPDAVRYEELMRGRPDVVTMISVFEYVGEIAARFQISPEQALTLIRTVLHRVKDAVESDTLEEITGRLSPEWGELLDNA